MSGKGPDAPVSLGEKMRCCLISPSAVVVHNLCSGEIPVHAVELNQPYAVGQEVAQVLSVRYLYAVGYDYASNPVLRAAISLASDS